LFKLVGCESSHRTLLRRTLCNRYYTKGQLLWEKAWREADDEFLTESGKDPLRQDLQSPPGTVFGRFTQICREAHRRGKPELLLRALERLTPIRTASGEDSGCCCVRLTGS
jgi:hypothetical protein